MKRYNPGELEPKWQQYWNTEQTYKADLNSSKPKYFGMSMFNYPSGAGIHIGHAMNYTISDVMARFKRQQGYESYHPIGWDSFGLPAENFAIKSGISPQASMATIIPDYHKQYKAMGWSNDWSKEIATHEPTYYKWTQWIFSELFRNGLVYQDSRMQWWCDKCQTVLANEQIDANGKCWRHDSPEDPEVAKREVKQWFFKITDYADELLEATEDLDWSEAVKVAQKNWIGKSKGAEIIFEIPNTEYKIPVFTTRPDTIFGASFLALAPELEIIDSITTDSQKSGVNEYRSQVLKKTEIERQASKEKTGVFTGAYAVNPINGEQVPIWVADYVLSGYGTGAIMAVPAHDERDNEFALKYDLPIVPTYTNDFDSPFGGEGIVISSGAYNGLNTAEAREKIVADLENQGSAKAKTTYKLRDWSVSRQRYWGAPIPIIHCKDCGAQLVPDSQLPVVLPELDDFAPSGDGRSALARATDWLQVPCPKCGQLAERETDTLDTYICSSWYMLRYLDPANESKIFDSEIINKWMPVDFYNGADHATAHMIYARFITRFLHKIGLINNPEPFKKFLFNGKVTANDGRMFSKSKGNGVDPLEIIGSGYGADALRMYLMFAAPLDIWVKWDQRGVPGTFRFLSRVWNITQEYIESPKDNTDSTEVLKAIHPAIKKVTADLEEQKYNTAVATLMKTCNDLYAIKARTGFSGSKDWQFALESLVMMVAPFAPHIAEELWHDLGNTDSVNKDHWPVWDEQYIGGDTVTVVIQVNGKLRGEIIVDKDTDRNIVESEASKNENVAQYLTGDIKKVIFVPNKLVNFVV